MPITPPPPPVSKLSLLKGFLQIFLPLLCLLLVAGLTHYYAIYATERLSRVSSETLNVGLAQRMINSDIKAVVSDLQFLAEHMQRQAVFQMKPPELLNHIGLEFLVFAEKKGLYDQIRYIDQEGLEVVRINYNSGRPTIIPAHELQDKNNRYYFRDAIELGPGEIYSSPLDLNIEGGKIEYPLKPVMRFATPVFDHMGNKRGIILLNYLGDRLIDNFTHAAANISDHIHLLNNQGYWLNSPDSLDTWGFMFGNDKTFGNRHPEAWKLIQASPSGQFETPAGLFTFTTVYPVHAAITATVNQFHQGSSLPAPASRHWKIVSHIPTDDLHTTLPLFLRQHLVLYLTMFVLITLGAALLAQSRLRHRRAVAQSEYEKRFRHTLENIELAAVALDLEGNIRFCNDYFLSLTHWTREELEGENWIDKFATSGSENVIRNILTEMTRPEQFPTHLETPVVTKEGQQRLIAWNNTVSYDAEGRVIGVTGIGEDITQKRHTEDELHKLFSAVEQSPSIVLITDRRGKIEYVNPKFTKVTGYQSAEVIGKDPSLLKSGETTSEEYHALWNSISHGGEWRGEFHNRRKNGELYWESASISAIRNAEGEITNYLAVKEDITERKRLEQEVDARTREIARTQTLTALGRMASMIAHDLRNPLSSVKMTLQILGKQPGVTDDEKVSELRQISLNQIRYMEEILSDMLTYSRPDAINPEWISIEKTIDTAIGLTQRKIDDFGVNIRTSYQPGLPTIYADANKLRQVFSNLITNAAQSTTESDRPEIVIQAMIELGPQGTGLLIEICDNGCGINEQERMKIFEPFFTTRAQGTGLGLAIVKRIIDQHQGSIELQPNERDGTCVSVVLPTAPQTVTETGSQLVEG